MMSVQLRAIVLATLALTFVGGPSLAYDPEANENVLVFDATGEILESYHVGDYTTGVTGAQIDYENYSPGSPPSLNSVGSEPYTFSVGETWIPNDLLGTNPPPPPGLPSASLFGFGDAIFSSLSSASPGVTLSPAGGAYNQTVGVDIQAYPSSAQVQIWNDEMAGWETFGNQEKVYLVQSRTLRVRSLNGGTPSPEKLATYTIIQDATVDTDGDGIPDIIEVLLKRFDPLIADYSLDTDGDGWPDIEEILRGSDPDNADSDGDGWSDADEEGMGTDPSIGTDFPAGAPPVYTPPFVPVDTDGDTYPDFDENLRSTLVNDASDYPTSRWLYEVETIASGVVDPGTAEFEPGSLLRLRVNRLDGVMLAVAGETGVVTGTYTGLRSPRGRPSIMRAAVATETTDGNGIALIDTSWAVRSFLPAIQDPGPGDVPASAWYSTKGTPSLVNDWLAAYESLLASSLVQEASGLELAPPGSAAVFLLDTMLTHLAGTNMGSVLAGRPGFGAAEGLFAEAKQRLIQPSQVPGNLMPIVRTFGEYMEDLEQIAENTPFQSVVEACYADWSPGEDIEKSVIGKLGLDAIYPSVLALSLSYQQMMESGFLPCRLLDPFQDLDADDLANYVEALGLNKGRESSIFSVDTDGDGIDDPDDNCPTYANVGDVDGDSDGEGDGCDPDDDGDQLNDVLEASLLYGSMSLDTDGDGWPDNAEFHMGLDANDPTDAIFRHGKVTATPVFANVPYPHPLSDPPLVFASAVSNDNGVPVVADLNAVATTRFQVRIDKDPGHAGAAPQETVSYLATSHLPDGWNAGRLTVGLDWETVPFDFPYSAGQKPLVIFSIGTENSALTLYPEVNEITNTGFSVRIRANSFHTPPATVAERVSWFACLPGSSPFGGETGESDTTAVTETITFDSPFVSPPDLLVSLEGMEAQTVVSNLTESGFDIRMVKDAAVGGDPGTQRLSWVALGEKVCEDPDMDGVCSTEDNSPLVYNPDQVDTDGDGTGNVEDPDADDDGLLDAYEASFMECGLAPFDPDTDGDGIIDGLEDYDGDGATNAEEMIAGTDPFNPADVPSEAFDAKALLKALADEGISPETLFEFALFWMTEGP